MNCLDELLFFDVMYCLSFLRCKRLISMPGRRSSDRYWRKSGKFELSTRHASCASRGLRTYGVACTISLVSAGVRNGRCVHSPGLDSIRRALQQRCATAQQLQSTCKSDENHVETMQKGPKTKFMAIKRRFTRVLKTKTDGPPLFNRFLERSRCKFLFKGG